MPDATASRRVWLVLGALTLIGFALRIYRLNHSSLWMDEVLTIARADPALSWREFFHFRETEPHPVWHHGLLKVWLTIFGYTEFHGRFLSVLLGTLSIPATYLLARGFAGERGSLFASLVAAFNYYLIFYSQELTPYAHWYTISCLSYWFFYAYFRRPSLWTGAGYAAATLIALHVHFYSAFMIAAQFSVALHLGVVVGGVRGAGRMFLRFAPLGGLFLLSLIPMADLLRRTAEKPDFIKAPPDGAFPFEYFYRAFGHSILLTLLAALPIALALVVPLHRWFARPRAAANPALSGRARAPTGTLALFLVLALGLFIPYVVSVTVKPVLFHRYTMYVLPIYFALMAIGFDVIADVAKRRIFVVAITTVSLWVLVVGNGYYSHVRLDQPREVVRFVAAKNAEIGIRPAIYLAPHPTLLQFYMRANGIHGPILRYDQREEIPVKLESAAKGDLFWLISSGWHPPQHVIVFVGERYDLVTEGRFPRGYAGLFRVR